MNDKVGGGGGYRAEVKRLVETNLIESQRAFAKKALDCLLMAGKALELATTWQPADREEVRSAQKAIFLLLGECEKIPKSEEEKVLIRPKIDVAQLEECIRFGTVVMTLQELQDIIDYIKITEDSVRGF